MAGNCSKRSFVGGASGRILPLECLQWLARLNLGPLGLELFEQPDLVLAVLVLIPMGAHVRV